MKYYHIPKVLFLFLIRAKVPQYGIVVYQIAEYLILSKNFALEMKSDIIWKSVGKICLLLPPTTRFEIADFWEFVVFYLGSPKLDTFKLIWGYLPNSERSPLTPQIICLHPHWLPKLYVCIPIDSPNYMFPFEFGDPKFV